MTKLIDEDMDDYSEEMLRIIRLNVSSDINIEAIEAISLILSELSLSVSFFRKKTHEIGPWTIEWLVDFVPDEKNIKEQLNNMLPEYGVASLKDNDLDILEVENKDWLQECYQQFQPFAVDGFYIYGSHYDGDVPSNLTGLQIDAATAFGSGEHGTTKGCLMALEKLVSKDFKPSNIMDMGAGSGILAIAGYKRYNVPTIAVDNDKESVRMAEVHRDLNNVSKDDLASVYGDGYKCNDIQGKKYDLIFVNILAGPLIEMAVDLALFLSDKGYAILSGMLVEQADDVLNAHIEQGLELVDRIDIDGWSSLTIRKK